MILFLEVAGLLILLGKSVRRKNEMENVGDLKKKKRARGMFFLENLSDLEENHVFK